MWPYSPAIISAISKISVAFLPPAIYLIIGSIVSETIKSYLVYSSVIKEFPYLPIEPTPSSIATEADVMKYTAESILAVSSSSINLVIVFKNIVDTSMIYLIGLLEALQARVTLAGNSDEVKSNVPTTESTTSESTVSLSPTATEKCLEETNNVIDSIREVLKSLHEYGMQYMMRAAGSHAGNDADYHILSDELITRIMSILMDETALWLSRRYVYGLSAEKAEIYEVH